jgi:hypothetical protein
MRTLFTLTLFSAAACVPAAFGQVTAIVDTFSTTGGLTGSTPNSGVGSWTNISGSTGLSVSSGALTIAGAAGESSQLNFSSSNVTSGTIYMGFDYTVSSSGSISTSDSVSAIAGFRAGTAASGTYAVSFGDFRPSAAAQAFSGVPATTTSQVAVGVFTGSSLNASTSALTSWATPLTRGTTYRVVLGFDLTNNTLSLWLNPTSISATSVTLSGITSDARGVFFRAGATTHGSLTIDNLNVSTDFATAAAIPEPATVASLFCLGLVGIAIWRESRRRRENSRPIAPPV